MHILKHLRDWYRSLRRRKPVLLRTGGLVLGTLDEPHRLRKSGLQEADYLLAIGGQRLHNGDIEYSLDPAMLHPRYDWPIRSEPQVLLSDDRLPDAYKAAVLQQLKLFMMNLGEYLSKRSSEAALREELRTAAFEALRRLSLQIRELEHPQRDHPAGPQEPH